MGLIVPNEDHRCKHEGLIDQDQAFVMQLLG